MKDEAFRENTSVYVKSINWPRNSHCECFQPHFKFMDPFGYSNLKNDYSKWFSK